MNGGINIGGIYADLDVNSGNMEAGLAKGQAALQAFEARLNVLKTLLARGAIGLPEFTAQTNQLNQAIADLAARMRIANTALGGNANAINLMNASMEQSTGSAKRFSIAMMQLGYMVDDVQYGISAVINNIAPFAYGLSGSAGVAAAAQIASVAIYQLVSHLEQIQDMLGVGKTRTEAEEMEYLGSKTRKTADEQERFNKLKREQHEIDEMMAKRPTEEVERASVVAKVIQDADSQKIAKGVAETMLTTDRGVKLTSDEKKEIEDKYRLQQEKETNFETIEETIFGDTQGTKAKREADAKAKADAAIKSDIADEERRRTDARAKILMRDAQKDPEKTKELLSLVNLNPGAFPAGFTKDLEDSLPENKAAQDALEREGQARGKMIMEQQKADDKAAKEAKDKKEKADKDKEKADKERDRQVVDIVKRTAPDLKDTADRAAEKLAEGSLSKEQALGSIQDRLNTTELSPDEQRKAAEEALLDTEREDPKERARRLRQKAEQRAHEAIPDLKSKADRLANQVHKGKLSPESANEALRGIMTGAGVDEDDARKAAESEQARTARENPILRSNRLKSETARKAGEIVPDLNDKIEQAVAIGMASGKGDDRFRSNLKDMLKKGGMDQDEAGAAVKDLFREGTENVRQRLAGVTGPRGQGEQPSKSEIYSTSDLTAKIQSSIGTGDETKKQTSLLEKQYDVLKKIAGKASVQIEVS